jgi:hypothetical protein
VRGLDVRVPGVAVAEGSTSTYSAGSARLRDQSLQTARLGAGRLGEFQRRSRAERPGVLAGRIWNLAVMKIIGLPL